MPYTHTQKSRARSEKHCRRRGASSGQKTRGCIEGEKPGRRRYKEVLSLERGCKVVFFWPTTSQRIPHSINLIARRSIASGPRRLVQ